MAPPPLVEGVQSIGARGALVIAANHYQRRGLWIGWPGAVITQAVAEARPGPWPVHWLVTGGLRFGQTWGRGAEIPGAARILRRVARTYRMGALPLGGVVSRASALREWLGWAEKGEVLGMFPEGLAGNSKGIRTPEAGFDSLCRILSRRNVPLLPTAIFECQDRLHVSFAPTTIGPEELARIDAAERVMRSIAELLPEGLRGVYGTRVNF
jgi:hypothetical protein